MAKKNYYIKERRNPQLGVYFVCLGQLSKSAAKREGGKSLYGENRIHEYLTKEEYEKAIAYIKDSGYSIQ